MVNLRASLSRHVDFQLALNSGGSDCRVNVSLSGCDRHLAAELFAVANVNVTAPSNPGGRTGPFPDALVPLAEGCEITIKQGTTVALWVSLEVDGEQDAAGSTLKAEITLTPVSARPSGSATGAHHATVTSPTPSSSTGGAIAIPVSVTVSHAAVPSPRTARLIIDSAVQAGAISHDLPGRPNPPPLSVLKQYHDLLLSHRVNALTWHVPVDIMVTSMNRSQKGGGLYSGGVQLNTTLFDELMGPMLDDGPIATFSFPLAGRINTPRFVILYNASWCFLAEEDTCVPLLDDPSRHDEPLSEAFRDEVGSVISAVKDHLSSRGWLNRSYVMFKDEPNFENNETRIMWLKLANFFQSQGLRIIQTTFPVPDDPELHPYVDWWLAHIKQYMVPAAAEQMAQERIKGKTVSVYHNGVPITDLSGVRLRSFPWQIWASNYLTNVTQRAGLQGTLAWYSVNSWVQDPYRDANTDGPGGKFTVPGFGYELLPSRFPDGTMNAAVPLASVRWKLFRLGIEDAELFFQLSDRVVAGPTNADRDGSVWAAAGDALKCTTEVTFGWYEVGDWSESTYTKNTSLVDACMEQVYAAFDLLAAAEA